eukprot:GHVS01043810.1.p1 GENE.GHVS01043810.1~~GHVS01043810.1.p1  ORF type:complete len:237 (+),score=32.77 GHVS01043810.1:94-804(+)
MSVAPVTYGSPTVRGAQPPPGFFPGEDMAGYAGGDMNGGIVHMSEGSVLLKGRGLSLVIVAVSTTVLSAIVLVGDYMSPYLARKIIDPFLMVGLAIVTLLFFLDRRMGCWTTRMMYCCYTYIGLAVIMFMMEIYSVIAITVDLCNNSALLDEKAGVFILFIVVLAVCAGLLGGFTICLQNSIAKTKSDASKQRPGERVVVQVVPHQSMAYAASPTADSSYDGGTSAFYAKEKSSKA